VHPQAEKEVKKGEKRKKGHQLFEERSAPPEKNFTNFDRATNMHLKI